MTKDSPESKTQSPLNTDSSMKALSPVRSISISTIFDHLYRHYVTIIVTINNPSNPFVHSIQIITWTLINMTNRFISQHLLDNSIFASTFSPESILGIIGQSEESSYLVSDQKRCYIAPVLKRGWLDTRVYLARPSWFHLGQSADGVLPTLKFPTLTDLTTFLFNFELWALHLHWLGGRQTQRGRQTCTGQYDI